MRRYLTYTGLILAVMGFACQSSQKNKTEKTAQVLRINIRDEPQSLDPRKANHLNSLAIVHMAFDGLTRVGKESKVEPSVAKKVTISDDLKTYTFHLRDSLWSNGDPVLASDFAYAWKKILSPNFISNNTFLFYVIKNARAAKEGKISLDEVGIRVLDDKTLQVDLINPTPYFLELTALPAFFPVNQSIDEKDPAWFQNSSNYVGNGPFQLTQWKHQYELIAAKNEKYWDASKVQISSIHLQMVPEETEIKMFEKKELDWAGSPLSTLPLDALKVLKNDYRLQTKRGLGTFFIRTNTEFGPLKEPLIRKALALAINRQAIVDHVTQGNQLPATGLVPLCFGLQREPYFKDGDVDAARLLFEQGLAALQLTKEQFPKIKYLYRAQERSHLIAQAIQQQWFEAFGIGIKLEAVEGKVFFGRVSTQDYHLAYGDWVADFPDPINFLEVFKYKKGGSNNTLWENPKYTDLLERSCRILDTDERMKLLASGEQILMDEMPIIPVLYSNMLYLTQNGIKDVVLSAMGIDFKWASKEVALGEKSE